MATYTPPPYFPQGSLSPPDENRYRRFKLVLVAALAGVVLLLGGALIGLYYLARTLF